MARPPRVGGDGAAAAGRAVVRTGLTRRNRGCADREISESISRISADLGGQYSALARLRRPAMTSGSAGSNRSNNSISRVRTVVRSSPAVRAHQCDQPVECRRDVLLQDLDVGRGERGLDVVGRGVGGRDGVRRLRGCAGQERDLAHRALGLCVIRVRVQDRLIGGQRGVEVPGVQMRTRLRQFGVDLLGLVAGIRLRRRAFRRSRSAASRSNGAADRAAAGPGSSTTVVRRPAPPRSGQPARRTSERPGASVSTLTVASDHLPPSAAASSPSASPSWTLASLRGDHSSTTTGTWLDRTSTSASKLASVISTPAGAPEACPARAFARRGARCLRPERSTAPAMEGPVRREDGDESRPQVCHVVSGTDRPGCADARQYALAAPIRPVRSAHMRKITLHSGTMLASNASNHVPGVHLTAIPTSSAATTKAMKTARGPCRRPSRRSRSRCAQVLEVHADQQSDPADGLGQGDQAKPVHAGESNALVMGAIVPNSTPITTSVVEVSRPAGSAHRPGRLRRTAPPRHSRTRVVPAQGPHAA